MTYEETVHQRKFLFAGTCLQYVRYLEEKVEQLQRQLASSSPSRDESQLVVQLEHPEKQTAKKQTANAKSAWITKCNQTFSFVLARTPAYLSEWSSLSYDTKLNTREEVLDAFKTLTLRSSSHPLAFDYIPRREPTHSVVQTYSGLQSFLQHLTQNSTQLANYSSLLFFCICLVARSNGMSVEDVDNLLENAMGLPLANRKSFARPPAWWLARSKSSRANEGISALYFF